MKNLRLPLSVMFAGLLGLVVITSSGTGKAQDTRKKKKPRTEASNEREVITTRSGGRVQVVTITNGDTTVMISGDGTGQLQHTHDLKGHRTIVIGNGHEKPNRYTVIINDSLMSINGKRFLLKEDSGRFDFNLDFDLEGMTFDIPPVPPVPPVPPAFGETVPPAPPAPPAVLRLERNGTGERNDIFVYNYRDGDKVMFIRMMKPGNKELEKLQSAGGVSGRKSLDDFTEIKVYPNPNDGEFNLSFNLKEKSEATVRVTDMNGKEIFTETIHKPASGKYEHAFNLKDYPNGTYFISVVQGDQQVVRKIILGK
jgi:hypothetical protein